MRQRTEPGERFRWGNATVRLSRRDNQTAKPLATPVAERNHPCAAAAGNLILIDARLSSRFVWTPPGTQGPISAWRTRQIAVLYPACRYGPCARWP